MSISETLREVLVEPGTLAPLQELEGELLSTTTGLKYQIIDGIPVLIPQQD